MSELRKVGKGGGEKLLWQLNGGLQGKQNTICEANSCSTSQTCSPNFTGQFTTTLTRAQLWSISTARLIQFFQNE